MKMSIKDLPKHRREEITVLEILRRNFREQKKKGTETPQVVLEIPLGDVNYKDEENISPDTFCRIVPTLKGEDIKLYYPDKWDTAKFAYESPFPEQVVFCEVTVSANFDDVCEELLQEAWGETKTDAKKIALADHKVLFDDEKAMLKVNNQPLQLPPFMNGHYLCRTMYEYPVKTVVDWSQIYEKMSGFYEAYYGKEMKTKEKWRPVYDAMEAVNKSVQEVFNTDDDLFTWRDKTIRRNY